MQKFELLSAFNDKIFIIDLKLCRILMEDSEYPWIFLIPMRANVFQLNQLIKEDRLDLIEEINLASNIMENLFETNRLNVAMIGNKTPQLHVHIISRREGDSLWPETIWGKFTNKLSEFEKENRKNMLKNAF